MNKYWRMMRWKNAFGVWNKKEIWFDIKIMATAFFGGLAIIYGGEIYDFIIKY